MIAQRTSTTSLLVLLSSFLLAAPQSSADQPPKPTSNRSIFVIEQIGSIAGRQTIYLAPDAVRIDNKEQGTVILSRAPSWDVTAYSKRTGRYFQCPRRDFKGNPMKQIMMFFGLDTSLFDFRKGKSQMVAGHRATRLVPYVKPQRLSDPDISDTLKLVPSFEGFLLADDIDAAPQTVDLVSKLLNLPPMHKLPLELCYKADDRRNVGLGTKSIKTLSRSALPKDTFLLPAGLKKARSFPEVFTDLQEDMPF